MRPNDDTASEPMLGTLTARSSIATLALAASVALSCPAQQLPSQQPPAAALTPPPDLLEVQGRLTIHSPHQPLHLGEPNPIDLTLRGPEVRQIFVVQSAPNGSGLDVNLNDGAGQATVDRRSDGSAYVKVVPVALGRINIALLAQFADGGIERESVDAQVIATQPPSRLELREMGALPADKLRMDLSPEWRQQRLFLMATFPGVRRPLYIPWSDAHVSLTFDQGPPAVRFDPATGAIDALRLGHALFQASYGGLNQTACILVQEFNGYSRSGCDELLPGGDRILPTAPGADAPGAGERSTLPYTAADGRRGRFVADDRVAVIAPDGGLQLAQSSGFALTLHGPAVARVECQFAGNEPCIPWTGAFHGFVVPLTRQSGNRATMQVFPSTLGDTTLTFQIFFVDGGVALEKVKTTVGLGAVAPSSIGQACLPNDYDAMPIRLSAPFNGVDQFPGSEQLHLFACYNGLRQPLVVPPASVHFSIKTSSPAPVVQVDARKGEVAAVAPGQALVLEEFAGHTAARCVVVPAASRNDPDVSNCRDLRARYGAPLPPLPPLPAPPRVQGANAEAVMQELGREQSIHRATLSPDVHDLFLAQDRLEIPSHGLTGTLAVPLSLPLHLHGPQVLAVTVSQTRTRLFGSGHPPLTYQENAFEESQNANLLMHGQDGSTSVSILPLEPHTAVFKVRVLFADGGVATRSVTIPVTMPNDGSLHLMNALEDDGPELPTVPASTLHLALQPPGNIRTLFPGLTIANSYRAILLNPRDVAFSVRSSGNTAVVLLDPATAAVTAQRIGHALITARYAGLESQTCVDVLENLTTGDPSNCEDLRTNHP